jgi:hypothetical protein
MMLRRLLSLLALTAGVAVGAPAMAQPQPQPLRDAAPERDWYGWQSAGLAGAGGLVFVSGLAAEHESLTVTGAFAFAFASPVSHWLRGNTGPGIAALALNVGMPFAALMTVGLPGAFLGSCRDDDCVTYPMLAGMALAMAIDAAALSWQERPRGPFLTSGLQPFVAPSADQLVVGMSWTS